LIREDADLKLIFHGEVSRGFAFFSKFIMPLAIGHHPLVTWVMFIIAGCLFASGIAVGFARPSYGESGRRTRPMSSVRHPVAISSTSPCSRRSQGQ
jgi:hypothetical protein